LDFSSAALYAVIETFAAFGMVFAYGLVENRASRSKGVLFNSEKLRRTSFSKKEVLPATLFLLIIILCFVIPLASIAVQSFTTRRLSSTPSFSFSPWIKLFSITGFAAAFATTLYTALIVSLLSTIAAFTYAVTLRIKDPSSQNTFLRTLPLLPMAVSSVVISLGMTFMVKRGTVFLLVLAQTALYWPFAFRQIYTPLSKMPDSVLDAANILSPYRFDALFRICIPYSFKGIVSAIGFCFALSAGDATIPLVLAIPHFDTLALFTYRLAGSHRFSEACASGLMLGILCAGIFTLSNKWKWRKI
jgi:thiamine transport system permease protein